MIAYSCNIYSIHEQWVVLRCESRYAGMGGFSVAMVASLRVGLLVWLQVWVDEWVAKAYNVYSQPPAGWSQAPQVEFILRLFGVVTIDGSISLLRI